MFAKDDNGTLRVLNETVIRGSNGEKWSRQILDFWSAAELKTLSIYSVVEDVIPDGKRVVSQSFVKTGDIVHLVKVLEDIPGAVPHAIGVNGTVTESTIMVPLVTPEPTDVFPSSLTVGQTYDVKDIKFDKLDALTYKILFQLINRLQVLEAKPPITAAQFKTYIKNQMA